MKDFFKENFVLAIGITLPLILIAIFYIAGQTARISVEDPKYSALFATNYHPSNKDYPYSIFLDDGKITVNYRETKNPHYQIPKLFIFDHKTLLAEELPIDFHNVENGRVVSPTIDDLNLRKFIKGTKSPDGYSFEYHHRSSGGLVTELFGYNRYRTYHALKNGPRAIPIKGTHNYYGASFIAWIDN